MVWDAQHFLVILFGITVDSLDNVYVADSGNAAIRKITPEGKVTTIDLEPEKLYGDDPRSGRFNVVKGIGLDSEGNIFAADSNTHTIHKITHEGKLITFAGHFAERGKVDAIGDDARFNVPTGIALDKVGNIYVADSSSHTIRKITPKGEVTTIAGQPGAPGAVDGDAHMAKFNFPLGVAVDLAGNVYVADSSNSTIRKIDQSKGLVTTIAGVAGKRGSSDAR